MTRLIVIKMKSNKKGDLIGVPMGQLATIIVVTFILLVIIIVLIMWGKPSFEKTLTWLG